MLIKLGNVLNYPELSIITLRSGNNLFMGRNMTRTRTRSRSVSSAEIDKNQDVNAPLEEVGRIIEQEHMLVPTPTPDSEEPITSNDEEEKASTEQKQPSTISQDEEGKGSNDSETTEQLSSELGVSTDSRTYSSGFGWVVIDGKKFKNDVIVLMDGSILKRDKNLSRDKKSKYGHTPLTRKELLPLLQNNPDLIVIGTGHNGAMPITPKAAKILNDHISFIGPTPEALDWMQRDGRKAVALLHVTC